jgi:hypothetical protein
MYMILDRYMATDFLKMLNQFKNENIVTYTYVKAYALGFKFVL